MSSPKMADQKKDKFETWQVQKWQSRRKISSKSVKFERCQVRNMAVQKLFSQKTSSMDKFKTCLEDKKSAI